MRCITLYDQGSPFGCIALINDQPYPALGGCRILFEKFSDHAITLCVNLANTMQKKSAQCHLPLNGGKAVLCIEDPAKKFDYLKKFSDAINTLQGSYITAVDIGTSQMDMDYLSQYTSYVTCHSAVGGDPSYYTAKTVLIGIMTALAELYTEKLTNQHIIVQGGGKVGTELIKMLRMHYPHVKISLAELDSHKAQYLQTEFGINLIASDQIYQIPCDIFVTAANSELITVKDLLSLNCRIFAAAANNPFQNESCIKILAEKQIHYLPDYLINCGGVIYCAYQYGLIKDLEHYIKQVSKNVSHYLIDYT